MRIAGSFLAVVATIALVAGSVQANDAAEMADLQARIATLEATMMAPAGGGDAEALTSLRKKGSVKIGGKVSIDVETTRRDEANTTDDHINRTVTHFDACDLDIRVDAGTDSYLFINFDMTGDTGDEVCAEVIFVWENVRGSNWDLVFGKTQMPFGQGKDNMLSGSFVDDGAPQIMSLEEADQRDYNETLAVRRQIDNGGNGTTRNDAEEDNHESQTLMANWQGDADEYIGLVATYSYKDLAKLDLAVFQHTTNMYEDLPQDRFQSFSSKL